MNKRIVAFAVGLLFLGRLLAAQEENPADDPDKPTETPNVPMRTLGGSQFWTDELVFGEWRVQRNVVTTHCRLLDEKNRRHAWGTFDTCQKKLNELKVELKLEPPKGKVIIALHGMSRTRNSMDKMCSFLYEHGGYQPINVGYASTREPLAKHAAALDRIVENLGDDVTEINFVAHSLGNLVIRHYLADQTDKEKGKRPDPRIKRIVMLGPPNHGPHLASRFKEYKLYQLVMGKVGQQMADWDELSKHLIAPACEFGIVAGGRGDESGRNPLLEGDDDLVVSVEETRLVGAADFIVLPVIHSLMMQDDAVLAHTLQFLRHGFFVSNLRRQPINEPDATGDQP